MLNAQENGCFNAVQNNTTLKRNKKILHEQHSFNAVQNNTTLKLFSYFLF